MNNYTYGNYIFNQTFDVYFYASVIVVPIGLISNFKSFLIYQADTFENEYIAFHYSLQVILKSIALVWDVIIYKYLTYRKIDIASFSQYSCVLFIYISRVITQLPYYVWSFQTYLNYLSVFNPARQRIFSKKINFLAFVFMIMLVLLVINVPSSLNNYIQINNDTNRTEFKCIPVSDEIAAISMFISSMSRFLIPFILINYFSFKPVKTLINRKRMNNGSDLDEKKLVIKYIFFDVMYILINSPFACLEILVAVNEYIYKYSTNSSYMINLKFSHDIARVIASIFYFFTNILGFLFNRFEREYLFSLLKKLFCIS